MPVYLCTKKERKKFRLDRELWVEPNSELVSILKRRFGEENLKII
jgi:DNA polymerase-3 subunit alpha